MNFVDCCIVGGGPAGALLTLLLARRGVSVALLEAHPSADRHFRGNTLSPAALDLLDRCGLAARVLALPHARIPRFCIATSEGPFTFADFTGLPTHYPFVLLLPQAALLDMLLDEARQFAHVQIMSGARARELIVEDRQVCGVRYRTASGENELRARLTIGADGRFSTVRKLAELPTSATASPIDVVWFRLPRTAGDPAVAEATFRFGHRALLVIMDSGDTWQVGVIIEKGSYPQLRERGLAHFRCMVADLAPELADRLGTLADWSACALLPVESSRARRWYRPGLLLIGDAAHVMSPVGGVGITCALQDAQAAADVLAMPLRTGTLATAHLRAVQRRRSLPTAIIQAAQHFAHRQVVDGALASERAFRIPRWLRLALALPGLRHVPARLIGFGSLLRPHEVHEHGA